ncbi:MAG TPA: UDP-3-O-(3-hydroxymyristoyl)glucosamine N-acyltransferase [Verrucomicrobiota bacterium]|nr:UDP-3-O-(3-hydroxymyristoyl)glucosamine N-acyltransferase [Verrucomicrobiota bacterium]HQL80232.1 UDP-3-O-(3-hydroxymyristoyl)glucosamine N-acyltransferase [Verrucomicrobiota bacterium]
MAYTVADVAKLTGGEVLGDGTLVLKGFSPADRAQPGDLTFAENENYFARAEQSAASVILVDGPYTSRRKTLIRVPHARIAFAKVLPLFFPEASHAPGIHPTALVPASAQVDATAHVGPYCVLGEKVRIGPRTVLQGLDHVGADCLIGADVNVFPNVTLYPRTEVGNRVRIHAGVVVGSDGFGYVFDNGTHRKVPQIGNVVICDDVELGANATVDRGALGPTIIGKGTKVDNLVQIAHNVTLGEHCIIVAQVGIAGSTKVGNYVVLGGQAGLSGHLKIGNRVSVAAQSGVMHNIPDGEKWIWTPAQPDRQAKRQMIALQQLPELLRRVKELEKLLGQKAEPAPPAEPARPK